MRCFCKFEKTVLCKSDLKDSDSEEQLINNSLNYLWSDYFQQVRVVEFDEVVFSCRHSVDKLVDLSKKNEVGSEHFAACTSTVNENSIGIRDAIV